MGPLTLRTPLLVSAALVVGGLVDPAGALGAPSGESTPLKLPAPDAAPAPSHGASGGLVRSVVGLAVVLGVIYGLAWVLRQVRAAREGQPSGAGLQAVGSVPLGPSSSLHLVRAGRELVLVGVGEKGVVPIRAYGEAEAHQAGLGTALGDGVAEAPVGVLEADGVELTAASAPRALGRPALAPVLAGLRRATVRR